MASQQLLNLHSLSQSQKSTLRNANLRTVTDLLLTPPSDIAKNCKFTHAETSRIVENVCRECVHIPRLLGNAQQEDGEKFTTGDAELDYALGGGIRTGMIWEVVGESAAGKTQLALQLSLMAQLPLRLGGLSGSTCYLTTSSQLQTQRLLQIYESHPLLSPEHCSLDEIRTLTADTIPKLVFVLSTHLPQLVLRLCSEPSSKPVKLVVIDALAELFRSFDKITTATLVERSRSISEISNLLHVLTSNHRVAVLVLNEVTDVFHHDGTNVATSGELIYQQQTQWFSRADTDPGEDTKEAALGLVWANQVNARIMLSRTNRRQNFDDSGNSARKRRRMDPDASLAATMVRGVANDESILIRRLSIIFSSVSLPMSLDFVVMKKGICVLSEANAAPQAQETASLLAQSSRSSAAIPSQSSVSPLDEGCVQDEIAAGELVVDEKGVELTSDDDDDTLYWNQDAIASIERLYSVVDSNLPQERL